jgi:hypothetical protein
VNCEGLRATLRGGREEVVATPSYAFNAFNKNTKSYTNLSEIVSRACEKIARGCSENTKKWTCFWFYKLTCLFGLHDPSYHQKTNPFPSDHGGKTWARVVSSAVRENARSQLEDRDFLFCFCRSLVTTAPTRGGRLGCKALRF